MPSSQLSYRFRPSLWRRLIALLRLVIIIAVTLDIAITLSISRLLLAAKPDWRSRVRAWHFRVWSKAMISTLGGRTIVHGKPPEGRFFLVSNHLSYLDILVLAQFVPAVFVAKAEVKNWPFIGWLTGLADTLYVDRGRHRTLPRVNGEIDAALKRGDSVALFPEGTSSDSDWVLPIRPPLLQIAVEHVEPVRTAALYFETEAPDPHAHDAICYFGDMQFVKHVWRLLHIKGFEVTLRFSEDRLHAADRKQLARQVRESIIALQRQNNPTAAPPIMDEPELFKEAIGNE